MTGTGSTGRHGWRPGSIPVEHVPAPGVRIVIDMRPLQDPGRAPLTAAYLESLLGALDADPQEGESFAFLLSVDRDDPTTRWPNFPSMRLESTSASSNPFYKVVV